MTATNKSTESILFGIIGLLIGVIVMGFFGSYAVNNNNSGMMGMMGINRNQMTGDKLDKRFIEQMIPHHESAIAMSKLAEQRSNHTELKTLAKSIIASQTSEIDKMKSWYESWYGTPVPETNTGMMMGGEADVRSLSTAADFDKEFLEAMIPHHQMAVMMANMLERGTSRPEMKQLALDIKQSQSKEISQMQSWQADWGYESNFNPSRSPMMMN